jgi:Protein of unknown function (DUF1579)
VKMRLLLLAPLALAFLASQQALEGGDKDKKTDDPFAGLAKPGPEHKMLAKLEGTWDAKIKMWMGPGEPKESKGVLKRKMIMDGRYLREKFDGDFGGMKFEGLGLIGYDVNKKKYVMAWVDNFETGISNSDGAYDTGSKSYTFRGEEDNPQMGGKMKTRDVLTILSDDSQRFEMYRTPLKEGKEFKVMEIAYTRSKKAAKAEK